MVAREQAQESSTGRLMPEAGATAVIEWLDREQRSQSWLSRQVKRSTVHLNLVLRRQEGCSAEMARAIAKATTIPAELLLPPAHRIAEPEDPQGTPAAPIDLAELNRFYAEEFPDEPALSEAGQAIRLLRNRVADRMLHCGWTPTWPAREVLVRAMLCVERDGAIPLNELIDTAAGLRQCSPKRIAKAVDELVGRGLIGEHVETGKLELRLDAIEAWVDGGSLPALAHDIAADTTPMNVNQLYQVGFWASERAAEAFAVELRTKDWGKALGVVVSTIFALGMEVGLKRPSLAYRVVYGASEDFHDDSSIDQLEEFLARAAEAGL